MSNETYDKLVTRLAEVTDLRRTNGLLDWDMQTIMPPRGARTRNQRMATLSRISHEMFVADEVGEWLDELEEYEQSLPFDSDEASVIRVTRRDYRRLKILPSSLIVARKKAANEGYMAWKEARASSDFGLLQPHLETIVDLDKQKIAIVREAQDDWAEDYDVLLDGYEPRLAASEVTRVFDALKAATLPLVDHVRERAERVDDRLMHGDFAIDAQERLAVAVAKRLGFTDDAWRLDVTAHPFASSPAIDDIRITVRYMPDFLNAGLFGTMHEFGHGLYEHGVSKSLERTPLARGASMAFHESQSRMWENLIGRGRPFWTWARTELQSHFTEQFANASEDDLYRAVNKLGPSLIRVEADELTYNLHIVLRFEIERKLFSGNLTVPELPEVWNAKMKEYFGIDVPNDAQGVLQDVHWGSGLFGYFPTYALGNVVSLQLWERIRREIPDLDDQTARGEFDTLRAWLVEHIHQHGRKFTPNELLERVTGTGQFDPAPLVSYLTAKVRALYGD